jgi:hypothetical protein
MRHASHILSPGARKMAHAARPQMNVVEGKYSIPCRPLSIEKARSRVTHVEREKDATCFEKAR